MSTRVKVPMVLVVHFTVVVPFGKRESRDEGGKGIRSLSRSLGCRREGERRVVWGGGKEGVNLRVRRIAVGGDKDERGRKNTMNRLG